MNRATLWERWKQIALSGFHIALFFVILNTLLYGVFYIRDHYFTPNPVIAKYGMATLEKVYPEKNDAEIRELLKDVWTRSMSFSSYTGFKESAVTSTYVNVDGVGFRKVENQAPWPPAKNRTSIFLFGDSTMFGYGVADNETAASFLQANLRNRGIAADVYNFGQGRYFSVQQRILFEKLLVQGTVPKVALFINGISEYHPDGEPYIGDTGGASPTLETAFLNLPLGRAVTSFKQRLAALESRSKSSSATTDEYSASSTVNGITSVYLANKQMTEAIASAFGVIPLFVWQPSPLYKCDPSICYFGSDGGILNYSIYSYPRMASLQQTGVFGTDFLWAADIQASATTSLYVDDTHYNPTLAKKLADYIAPFVAPKLAR